MNLLQMCYVLSGTLPLSRYLASVMLQTMLALIILFSPHASNDIRRRTKAVMVSMLPRLLGNPGVYYRPTYFR